MCMRAITRRLSGMASLESYFAPPPEVMGMKSLDKNAFKRDVKLPAIKVPAKHCALMIERLKDVILKYKNTIKRVQDVPGGASNEAKVLLLTPEPFRDRPLADSDLCWIKEHGGEMTSHTVTLDYSHYSMHSILRAILPPEITDVPTAFESVGHIAHLNLRENQLPYKEIIGQVLLDKHVHIQTVVNKSSSIDETFRFFKMDLLAGEDRMVTTVKENGCSFTFDFSKVYWNSRLHTEHAQVIKELKKADTVLDMFAGVGPFAIPACKKGCLVYANDLNPHAYQALCENADKNKVSQRLRAFNLDGREFLRKVIGQFVGDKSAGQPFPSMHVIMNLPASAVEFLDTFSGLLVDLAADKDNLPLPVVNCYCFTKSSTPKEDCLEQVEKILRGRLETFDIFEVRDVSPNKLMMRVRFDLPSDVAFRKGDEAGPLSKKPRLDGGAD